jgi:hypothetical protein
LNKTQNRKLREGVGVFKVGALKERCESNP